MSNNKTVPFTPKERGFFGKIGQKLSDVANNGIDIAKKAYDLSPRQIAESVGSAASKIYHASPSDVVDGIAEATRPITGKVKEIFSKKDSAAGPLIVDGVEVTPDLLNKVAELIKAQKVMGTDEQE